MMQNLQIDWWNSIKDLSKKFTVTVVIRFILPDSFRACNDRFKYQIHISIFRLRAFRG